MKTILAILIFLLAASPLLASYNKTIYEHYSGKTDKTSRIGTMPAWMFTRRDDSGRLIDPESECTVMIATHFDRDNKRAVWLSSSFSDSVGVYDYDLEFSKTLWKGWDGNLHTAFLYFDEATDTPKEFIAKTKVDNGTMGGNDNIEFLRKCAELKFVRKVER